MLMPNRVSPGIVNVTDFVAAHAKKVGSYINYTGRDEAIRIDHFDHQHILSIIAQTIFVRKYNIGAVLHVNFKSGNY